MTHEVKPAPKLNDRQVADEIVNDSLGTVDPADTADTDPDDDPEAKSKGRKGSEA
ncbi:MAG TPA: hypothetical protein VGG56_17510 [Terracidiphilus sp.]|jgi:hypothetical protein